jgi:4-hydroxybenzoate polyprenyltransferase
MSVAKFRAISDLIRLDKQYGTLLLLLPTLWSLVAATQGRPSVKLIGIFILGAFLMRSAGCAVNDILDRRLDGFVERTRSRPLPSNRLSLRTAISVFLLLVAVACVLVAQLNRVTQLLAVGGLALTCFYPTTKRFFHAPQLILGVTFGWGALMAWAAVHGTIGLPAVLIFVANVFWAMAYDTIYALMDREDDRRIGIRSTAVLFGRSVGAALLFLFGMAGLFLLFLGRTLDLGPAYYAAWAIAMGLSGFQAFSVRNLEAAQPSTDPHRHAFRLFRSNVMLGLVILLGLLLDYHTAVAHAEEDLLEVRPGEPPLIAPNRPCIACHGDSDPPPSTDPAQNPLCRECHVSPHGLNEETQGGRLDVIGVSQPGTTPKALIKDDMVLIPSGTFLMGRNERTAAEGAGDEDETPIHRVHVEGFYMDRYEVTNVQYKRFADETGRPYPKHWKTGTYPAGKQDHPVAYVNWFEADGYCHWLGRRLPTEAEWEYAARGPESRRFPWGNTFDPLKANTPQYWLVKGVKADTTPVGSFPQGRSPFGLEDMAGNVYEWTSSWYKPYPGNIVPNVHYGEKNRIVRGGSWYDCLSYGCGLSAPSFNRSRFNPEIRNNSFGFRCAKSK